MRILVTGAGGFIGHHLVTAFKSNPEHHVTAIDIKPKPDFAESPADEYVQLDLTSEAQAMALFRHCQSFDRVFALAADMGGMGFIADSQGHSAQIMTNNLLININTLRAAQKFGTKRLLFTSSACVYPLHLQTATAVTPLKEDDAYPADPEDGYGWEKLTTEKLCKYFSKDHGIDTRIARFHNIYGPLGTWRGGREKSPAALCRKIAMAKLKGDNIISIWGDGQQTRSFCYVSDCVDGLQRLMESSYAEPLNIGSDRMISIDDLAYTIMDQAGYHCAIEHVEGPQGVRGRNSDNRRLRQVLGWEPAMKLEDGLRATYKWIEQQVQSVGLAAL